MPISFTLNGGRQFVDADLQTPLLWVLPNALGLTGTKFGCGIAVCGACTVHVNGALTRSCVTPVSSVAGKIVLTIEGLSLNTAYPVQTAWIEEDLPQCGNICRSGTYSQIRRAAQIKEETMRAGRA